MTITWRTLATHRYARLPMLALVLALGPVSLQAATASDPEICRIEFSEVARVSYGPESLTGFAIQGDYTTEYDDMFGLGVKVPFRVLDLDGFATFAFLHAQWRSSGAVDRNLTEPVVVPRRDLDLLFRTADMSLRYFDVLERNARASDPPNLPAILAEIEEKRLLARGVQWMVDKATHRSDGRASYILHEGEISEHLGAALERFAPGSSRRLFSQYRDLSTDDSRQHVLCDPRAENALIGQVLCGFVFNTADRRDPDFCPDGLLVAELAAVRSCKITNGVESDCRSSVVA